MGRIRSFAGGRDRGRLWRRDGSGRGGGGPARSLEDAETDEGDVGVLGAGGEIEALRRAEGVEDRGQDGLVEPEGDADGEGGLGVGHRFRRYGVVGGAELCCFSAAFWMARKTLATSRSRAVNSRSMTLRRGWRMTSTGVVRVERFLRTASRMRRLMRLRSTALPMTLPTVSPTRGLCSVGIAQGRAVGAELRAESEEVGHLLRELLAAGLVDALVVGVFAEAEDDGPCSRYAGARALAGRVRV